VRLRLEARNLVLASWETSPESVARTLPPGLVPAPVEGRHLVTLAALRWARGRLDRLPLPPFSQLNVRAYVEHEGETGVFFLGMRVTVPGIAAALFGVPVRTARLGVRPGLAESSGLGVRIRYEVGGLAEPTGLVEHALGIYEAAGLRAFRIRRGEATWRHAEASERVRADPLLALGFTLETPPTLLYVPEAPFEAEFPPRRLA
jgi:uncharacterized protein YqjF (DUF2071 family)